LPPFIHNVADLIRRVLFLAGHRQGQAWRDFFAGLLRRHFSKVIGITSIFSLLAIAADPSASVALIFGTEFLSYFRRWKTGNSFWSPGYRDRRSPSIKCSESFIGIRAHSLRPKLLHIGCACDFSAGWPHSHTPIFLQRNSGDLLKKIMGDVTNYAGGVLLPLLDTVARVLTAVLLLATLFLVQPIIAISALSFWADLCSHVSTSYAQTSEVDENLKIHVTGSYRERTRCLADQPVKVHSAEDNFLADLAATPRLWRGCLLARPIFANSARYFVEPLPSAASLFAVLVLAARGRDFFRYLPNLGVMALAGYRLLPSLQLLYAQLTQVSSMRHAVTRYTTIVAAETDKIVPRAISTLLSHPRILSLGYADHPMRR